MMGKVRWSVRSSNGTIEGPGLRGPGPFLVARKTSQQNKLPLLSAAANGPRISGAFGNQPAFRTDRSVQVS